MATSIATLWAEPRAPDAPGLALWDLALVAGLVPVAVLEGVYRDHLAWPVPSVVLCVVLILILLWRRARPLAAVAVAFGSITAVDLTSFAVGVEWTGLHTMVCSLLLAYSLFRWGSGREAAIGLPIILIPVGALPGFDEINGVVNVLAGILFVSLAMAIGAAVRYKATTRRREVDHVKVSEREQLARELHDTVAHHVSAIAVQAQAGRTVAATRPHAAVDALAAVEKEASRTLAEMRTMVAALRRDQHTDLAPQPGLAELRRLAGSSPRTPRVDVELSGDLDELPPLVDAALYRLAQESVTNAQRHARHATRIHVHVVGGLGSVQLTVTDDGDGRWTGGASSSGYGLVGMAERARLLGGTLEAGPGPGGGWAVRAVLPRSATT